LCAQFPACDIAGYKNRICNVKYDLKKIKSLLIILAQRPYQHKFRRKKADLDVHGALTPNSFSEARGDTTL